MADKSWKAFERRIAKRYGGERVPVGSSIVRGNAITRGERNSVDIITPHLVAQAKLGYNQPAYMTEWVDGVLDRADEMGLIGIVAWKAKYERDDNTLIITRARAFDELYGRYIP